MSEEENTSVEEEKVVPTASVEEAAEPEKKKEVTAEDLLKSDLDGVKIRRAKGSKNITSGIVNVLATFNNTKVTFCDARGNVISWSSAGKCNFRGSRKSTAYAAQVVTQDAGRVAMSHGMKEVVVKLNGPGTVNMMRKKPWIWASFTNDFREQFRRSCGIVISAAF